MMQRCKHYACRCARAAELAAMADRTNDPRLLAEAIAVHRQYVICRDWRPPDMGDGYTATDEEWYAMYPPDRGIDPP